MKALVFTTTEGDYDWSHTSLNEVFLVEDDVSYTSLNLEWVETMSTPVRWKNQYGEGMRGNRSPTMPFLEWLRKVKKLPQLPFEHIDW